MKNRLTFKNLDGTWGMNNGYDMKKVPAQLYGALCKLKDYEEKGLSPNDIDIIRNLYNDMIHKTTWTSVSESLPRKNENVLVIVNGNPVPSITLHNAYQLATYDKEDGWILECFPEWENPEVTAWISLLDYKES